MRLYRRLIDMISGTRAFAWVGRHAFSPWDRRFGRRLPTSTGLGLDPLRLTTTGRRSGEPHTVVLLHVADEAGNPVVAATNYGAAASPAWSLNLEANPEAAVERNDGSAVQVRARRASPAEQPALWSRLDVVWPAFPVYRDRAGREIPLYVLEQTDP